MLGFLVPSLMFLSCCFHSEIQVNVSRKLLISRIGGMALFDDVNSYYHPGQMYRGKVIPSFSSSKGRVGPVFHTNFYFVSFLTPPLARGLGGHK